MPSRRGWGLGVSSVAFAAGGRVFGIVELYVLAATSVALVVVALVYVRARFPRLATIRTLHPRKVHAGTTSRVELEVVNQGARRSPVIAVHDPFAGGMRRARFLVPPLPPGASSRAAYRLPTEERGVYEIGPLEVIVADPFGLAEARRPVAPVARLVVYPHVDEILPLPDTPAHDGRSRHDRRRALVGSGADFFALRPYEVGDDTRRVHWPSSARLDELMIRQDELPHHSRVTILLDTRSGVHDSESLEVALSAAASVHDACRRDGAQVRLVCTDGVDSASPTTATPGEAVMEHLATVQAGRGEAFTGLFPRLRRHFGGALVVVTTSAVPGADVQAVARLHRAFGRVVTVLVERGGGRSGAGGGARRHHDVAGIAGVAGVGTVVRVNDEEPFARAWDRALSRPTSSARR